MTYEIDHLMIMTDVGAPAANQLVEAGITEGAPNTHPGQGTTNRRFFFNNGMLEFIWVHDEDEATNNLTKPTYLLPRWQGRGKSASPFGVCFRPTSLELPAPFPSWDYKPEYLPEGMSMQIADTVNQIQEPFLFFASRLKAPDQKIEHSAGMENITSVHIIHPYPNLSSPSIGAIQQLVSFEAGNTHLLTVTFDDHNQGKTLDFQPDLPLIIHF